MKKLLLFVVPVWFAGVLRAQQIIGLPAVVNYTPAQYQGSGQTWDVDIDLNGILYFANNEGLLTFNGHFWKLHPVPNKTRLRSVKVDTSGRIYTGAQDEFGYYLPDANGSLRYTSLKPLIPAGQQEFADIWDIVLHEKSVFFRSNHKIFQYTDDTIKVYPAPVEWRMLCKTPSGLFAQDHRDGLLQFENGQWKSRCREAGMLITAVLEGVGDTLLITTLKDGLFKLYGQSLIPQNTVTDNIFRTHRIYTAANLSSAQLLIGTSSGGCYIIDKITGQVVQRFTIEEGLQNNNVLKVFTDARQNIWLALDNGIDLIRYNTAVKQIHPDKKNYPATYAAQVFNDRLYVGTTDGAYSIPLDGSRDLSFLKSSFQRVSHTKGQVWSLSTTNHQLLLGHHEGAFAIKDTVAAPLLKDIGCWLFLPFQPSGILAGCYNGLNILRSGKAPLKVPHLFESLRFLAMDKDSLIWASHPYRGVYRITLAADTLLQSILYTQQNGLPSDYNNFVFRVKNRIVIATQAGVYEFDAAKNTFLPSPQLYPVFKTMSLQYLREDANGNIWFVSDKKPGVVDFHKPSGGQPYSIVFFPELKGKVVSGFESIYPYNDENIFVGAEKGIYHINYKKYISTVTGPSVLIGQVNVRGGKDSLLYGGHLTKTDTRKSLPSAFNNFRFEYASPAYDQGNTIVYSYRLAGYDDQWSEWTAKTEKEYTNLSYGDYTFNVKARDNLGNTSATAGYSFTIRPAWYQTRPAWLFYILCLITLIWLLYRKQKKKFITQQRKHREEQEQLIYLHQLEREISGQQLIRLQNEKLAADVQFKNKELATAAMHLVQRGKLLFHIKEELLQTIKRIDPSPVHSFKKVMRLFEEAENNEEDWEHFSRHFDEVHNNFLRHLKKRFPELTTTDMKLCAYLRIHLTTKEIAQSMGISVRGVETSRYRLRKKLNIPADMGLHDFLNAVT